MKIQDIKYNIQKLNPKNTKNFKYRNYKQRRYKLQKTQYTKSYAKKELMILSTNTATQKHYFIKFRTP